MNQILPGVTKVGIIALANLPHNIINKAVSGIKVDITESYVTYLPIVGIPVCQSEDKFDNNSSYEKAKLTFKATDLLLQFPRKAFIVITVDGAAYLIGADNQSPIFDVKATSGEPSGESAGYEYEVSMTAKKALIRCYLAQSQ